MTQGCLASPLRSANNKNSETILIFSRSVVGSDYITDVINTEIFIILKIIITSNSIIIRQVLIFTRRKLFLFHHQTKYKVCLRDWNIRILHNGSVSVLLLFLVSLRYFERTKLYREGQGVYYARFK